jgi:hypothetical protein
MKIMICIILQLPILLAGAQKTMEKKPSASDYDALEYIRCINPRLPEFKEQKKWNELNNYMQNWKNSEAPSDELIFCISTLSAIEQHKIWFLTLPCNFLYLLNDYAREIKNIKTQQNKFKYYIHLGGNMYYDASPECTKLLDFTCAWANCVLSGDKLNASETFLCLVFSGQIENPEDAFHKLRKTMPELDAFQQQLDTYELNRLKYLRNRGAGTFSLMIGTWMPTGNLRTLGTHASASYLLGYRKMKNEYDLVATARLGTTTAQNYSILRSDTVYSRNYYGGGYIGAEYTRYFVHTEKFDFGPTIGFGYDEFDIATDTDATQTSLSPTQIFTLNLNTGLRFKYFFHKAWFVGLVLKYNSLNYENKGGTDLRGNACSIDISYGIF